MATQMVEQALPERRQGRRDAQGWLGLMSRWPITVYRLRLGWLMGHRFLLVTHRGRRSGKAYQTGVMVLRYDRDTGEAFVVAGSPRADWYRNIQAAPAAEIAIGRERYQPKQRFLDTEEIFELLAWSRRRHPFTARMQSWFFHWPWPATGEQLLALAAQLGGVAFRP